ncbi:Rad4-domain-containing protein [Terfezia boudieri ATCC MYA-4762]|uniref:Rad4-domain-containing protein n=1 Tax=Terfezia boudieri ATCC MYA-4762 TaxID=1051890 RepID=A0A3N4LSL3_9PEZI|nr:Rad4-domain-containing protein [Terfezia boudieri ATCC MYA-4762]
MSGRRALNRTQTQPSNRGGPARGRRRPTGVPVLPDVYQEMLRESGVGASVAGKKRRKVENGGDEVIDTAWPTALEPAVASSSKPVQLQREKPWEKPELVEEADEELDDSDDDDNEVDWEDVDLTTVLEPESGVLEVTLNSPGEMKRPTLERRKITVVDQKIRLEVHKLHLLCLMVHVSRRNKWCNNKQVQENLRRRFKDDTLISNLNPAPQLYQLERNTRFLRGLTEVKNLWRRKFWITRRGLARPFWLDTVDLSKSQRDDGDPPMSKGDFLDASQSLTGSRDLGAQLFCALLRSLGVTARLICSLQPMPFSFAQKGTTQSLSRSTSKKEESVSPLPSAASRAPLKEPFASPVLPQYDPRIPAAQREVLASLRPASCTTVQSPSRTPHVPARGTIMIKNESQYPVYWIEAWNVATQGWVPVDPLVLNKVGCASRFEPPQSDLNNVMSYVAAFEEEGHVKDVTRRYANNYNAKTRKLRLNATKGGELWWLNLLRLFERGWDLDRDQVEDSELASKELGEGIPSSVADLKDHPLFALKRHLRRNQVIYPERPVGSVTTGIGSKAVIETVYRRQDVKTVRSPMQWYRLGREIKTGEQPLKHITVRKRKRHGEAGEEDDESGETGLYAIFQTEEYIPPPVADGMVPKNSFGNIDIYVPSMVPKGGIHVPHKDAVRAAKIIGIDFAEAVTAFEHKGRQASAVIKGVVIAEQYQAALYAVLGAIISEKKEEDAEKKSLENMRLWKRFLLGLRIRERIENEYGDVKEGESLGGWGRKRQSIIEADKGKGKASQLWRKSAEAEGLLDLEQNQEAGGFMREDKPEVRREPISLRSLAKGDGENDAGGFLPEDIAGVDETGGFLPGDTDCDAGFMPEGPGIDDSGVKSDDDESMLSADPDMDNEDLDWF